MFHFIIVFSLYYQLLCICMNFTVIIMKFVNYALINFIKSMLIISLQQPNWLTNLYIFSLLLMHIRKKDKKKITFLQMFNTNKMFKLRTIYMNIHYSSFEECLSAKISCSFKSYHFI